jgi:hypothetical protein
MVQVVDPDRRVVVLQIISRYICRKLGARYGKEEFTAGRGRNFPAAREQRCPTGRLWRTKWFEPPQAILNLFAGPPHKL